MVWLPALVEVGLGVAAFAPFLIHRLAVGAWRNDANTYPSAKADPAPVTVLLPVWNEALILTMKLNNLAAQDMRFSLLIIDSCSTDDTVATFTSWHEKNPDAFDSVRLIEMEQRLGKTEAVRRAIHSLEEDDYSGLVCMTDADAMLPSNAVSRLQGWFNDPTIGAVGARAVRSHGRNEESVHRSMFELLREGESAKDSTPFLEGSCMMWKHRCFQSTQLNVKANADDAQIATGVRLNGFRSIHDSEVCFEDIAPTTQEGQRRQKIRRGQGLQRLLIRYRSAWFDRRVGTFAKILRREAHFHLLAPLLLFGAAIAAIMRWSIVSFAGMPMGQLATVHGCLALVELTALTVWLMHRQGIRVPVLGSLGAILSGMEHLLAAFWYSLRGRSLHMWEQHSDTRSARADAGE